MSTSYIVSQFSEDGILIDSAQVTTKGCKHLKIQKYTPHIDIIHVILQLKCWPHPAKKMKPKFWLKLVHSLADTLV